MDGMFRDSQLSSKVQEELELVLCSAEDSRLGDFHVMYVEAEPGGKKFICALSKDGVLLDNVRQAQEHVRRAENYLRTELVSALNLKKAPTFVFVVVPWES